MLQEIVDNVMDNAKANPNRRGSCRGVRRRGGGARRCQGGGGGGAREGGEEVAMAPGGAEEAGQIHEDAGPPHYDSPPITMPIDADKG